MITKEKTPWRGIRLSSTATHVATLILAVGAGGLLGTLTLRKETYIDYRSGALRERISIFNATVWDDVREDTLFQGIPMDWDSDRARRDWHRIWVYSHLEFFHATPYYPAYVKHKMRELGLALLQFPQTEARRVKTEFLRRLNSEGPESAGSFADTVLKQHYSGAENTSGGDWGHSLFTTGPMGSTSKIEGIGVTSEWRLIKP